MWNNSLPSLKLSNRFDHAVADFRLPQPVGRQVDFEIRCSLRKVRWRIREADKNQLCDDVDRDGMQAQRRSVEPLGKMPRGAQ